MTGEEAMDIIKLVSQFAAPTVLEQVGKVLGLSPGVMQKGLAAAIPGVLASLLGASARPGASDALGTALGQGGGLGDLLGSDPGAAATKGTDLLSSLLGGDGAGKLADTLGSYVGLPKAGAGSLLGVAGSMALGALGKQASEKGLDAQGVFGLLSEHKDEVVGALPADFSRALSGTGLLSGVLPVAAAAAPKPAPSQPARTPPPPPPPARSGWTKWLIWLIAAAVIVWLLMRFLSPEPEPEPVAEEPAPAPAETAADPAPEATPPAETETAAEPAPEATPPADTAAAPADPLVVGGIDVGAGVSGVLDQLSASFSGITDAASAEAALPQLTEARDTLNGLEASVSALPAEGKTALQQMVSAALPTIESTANDLLADSAVAGVVKPVVDNIIATLKSFAA
jgi:hypothetical protein